MHPKYEDDFYGWTIATAGLLKEKRMGELDIDHLIEELEDMGNNKKHAFVSRLAQLIFHLLKWQLQPDFRGRSWDASIKEQRKKIKQLLQENPSLTSNIDYFFKDAYDDSKLLIQKETPINLNKLGKDCPYTFEECLDDGFYPD